MNALPTMPGFQRGEVVHVAQPGLHLLRSQNDSAHPAVQPIEGSYCTPLQKRPKRVGCTWVCGERDSQAGEVGGFVRGTKE